MDILFLVASYAWAAAFLLSFSTSTLGCFVLWRRMSYFGDTLAHGSMLGFSLAIVLDINFYAGLLFTVFTITILLYLIEKRSKVLHMDSILGIVAHTSLATGFIIITVMARYVRVDVVDYLFGDLLAVNLVDLGVLLLVALIVVSTIWYNWKKLLAILVSQEMAAVEGINVEGQKSLLVFLLALVIAISISLVGSLIITSLLIIPASIARRFAKTPGQMILFSFLLSNFSFLVGIFCSVYLDLPTAPAIVATLGTLFFVSLALKRGDAQ